MTEATDFLDKARVLDQKDPLKGYQDQFHFPEINGNKALYFCGNSLGLQPHTTEQFVGQELAHWKKHGVEGHFTGENPWLSYHKKVSELSAALIGANTDETIIMNSLTANLHFLLCSFYQPVGKKRKIVMEKSAFPSDTYAIKSQLRFHGCSVEDDLILIAPDENYYYSNGDFVHTINTLKDEIALVLISGVHYLNGQVFDLQSIAKSCNQNNIPIGVDLAHATGNIPLELHDWNIDFAVWCSYKYLNSGPGGVGGAFIHSKHHNDNKLPRLEGWWSNKESNRFEMNEEIDPYQTAEAWQVSNAPVLSMAANLASLELFNEVGLKPLREKSLLLTGYLREVLEELALSHNIKILTPKNDNEHGAQISITFENLTADFPDRLRNTGVIADYRNLNNGQGLIRLAPVPFYNSFMDIYWLGEKLKSLI